jgi:hypothetical protein
MTGGRYDPVRVATMIRPFSFQYREIAEIYPTSAKTRTGVGCRAGVWGAARDASCAAEDIHQQQSRYRKK